MRRILFSGIALAALAISLTAPAHAQMTSMRGGGYHNSSGNSYGYGHDRGNSYGYGHDRGNTYGYGHDRDNSYGKGYGYGSKNVNGGGNKNYAVGPHANADQQVFTLAK